MAIRVPIQAVARRRKRESVSIARTSKVTKSAMDAATQQTPNTSQPRFDLGKTPWVRTHTRGVTLFKEFPQCHREGPNLPLVQAFGLSLEFSWEASWTTMSTELQRRDHASGSSRSFLGQG